MCMPKKEMFDMEYSELSKMCLNCMHMSKEDEFCPVCGKPKRVTRSYEKALEPGTILNNKILIGHKPVVYYCKLPKDIQKRTVIITDPMLATGGSACDALAMLKERGCTDVRLMCLVGAPEGIAKVQAEHPDVDIFLAAVDDHLNENAYIVPGLGDAGDRIFGTK